VETKRDLRIVSWNLLRRVGARAGDVAELVQQQEPDLLLLQEATEDMCTLPMLVGGHFYRQPMQNRIYGLAVWSPYRLPEPQVIPLPVSRLPGRVPPRVAQVVQLQGVKVANVHLSHGQLLNRLQLLHIAAALEGGPAAIIGDFNSVGPTLLSGFKDVGPRRRTHKASKTVGLRLDRCLARSLHCTATEVLDKGPSDHHPIVLDLMITSAGKRPRGKAGQVWDATRRKLARPLRTPRRSRRRAP
jgi:endonuclease/exonuclease/phosphatase family metal-dependent hydrolase